MSHRRSDHGDPTPWSSFRGRASALWVGFLVACSSAAQADEVPRYNRDIRPILMENCFACHGPDSAARKADLRLDQREAAIEAGSLTPGDPELSELIYRVESDDDFEIMPPPSSHKTLTDEQKATLRRWVEAGAEYEPHWSFIAPERPDQPEVSDPSWIRNEIDAFILQGLDQAGLSPMPEADRRTLARRASLDLTGLPPDPELVEAFVNDPSPEAYETYIDRLLASPQWGEHRARFWLDAARYADTHGLHFDNERTMWSYRDWVIKAFNQNMPFDQFTLEQLAGDLLPDRNLDQLIATGFNRCNITTNEGGTIPEENLVGYTRDRTETVATVFLGLTAGCATCHDHKYDPLSQREFYQLAAFFNNTTQGAMDGNIRDTPPIIPVPADRDRQRWDELSRVLAEAREASAAHKIEARPAFDRWLAEANAERVASGIPSEGQTLLAQLGEGVQPGPGGALEIAGVGDFDTSEPFAVSAWVKLPRRGMTGAVVARMDEANEHRGWDLWIEGNRVGAHLVHAWPSDALKVVSKSEIERNRWTHVSVSYDGSGKASGVSIAIDGQPQGVDVATDQLKETIRSEVPFKIGQRNGSSRLEGAMIRDVRIFNRSLATTEVAALAGGDRTLRLVGTNAESRPEEEVNAAFSWWLAHIDETNRDLQSTLAALEAEEAEIKARGTIAHVTIERDQPATAFVLHRGEYDQRREEVSAGTPAILPPMDEGAPRNRLGFARWLFRDDHPLTARVTVNRAWQELFGTGLVATAGDFGISGQLPSHPELLDWLAVEFRDSGWDLKHLYRVMVTSAAYRQSAAVSPEALERDPQNRLISRGPRFRMDAEMIRDSALSVSGLLADTIGGPSVKPYQPDGVWEAVAMPGSNTRFYEEDAGNGLYRRSLYTFWKRAAPPASMEVLNAPSREYCTVQRERTNTPLQALATLNDVQYVEAARHLAERTLTSTCESDDDRVQAMALRLVARPLDSEELEIVRESLGDLLAHYQGHPDDASALIALGASPANSELDPATLAAWTMLANQLMNLDEVLNK
ncbi:DUF1553 domain-containing protein [Tautonia rosea]|uniref:DUF1553 domain-containing protein n=1 Tax=Tautonia rosea TaxID=2728037 RepID=UPI0014726C41|nr:DUF1553 domain-containing protein [Tautonia rosea]